MAHTHGEVHKLKSISIESRGHHVPLIKSGEVGSKVLGFRFASYVPIEIYSAPPRFAPVLLLSSFSSYEIVDIYVRITYAGLVEKKTSFPLVAVSPAWRGPTTSLA